MEHIGIDLGSKDSQVCVRKDTGEIVQEWRCQTDQLRALLADRPPARVILETCTDSVDGLATRLQSSVVTARPGAFCRPRSGVASLVVEDVDAVEECSLSSPWLPRLSRSVPKRWRDRFARSMAKHAMDECGGIRAHW
jgi:hypothetical protein